MHLKLIVTLASSLLMANIAVAQVYQWVDEQGVTHFSSRPPPGMPAERNQAGSSSDGAEESSLNEQPAEQPTLAEEIAVEPQLTAPRFDFRNHALELKSLLSRRRYNTLNDVLSYYHSQAVANPEKEQQLMQLYGSFDFEGEVYGRLLNAWMEATPERIEPYLALTSYYYHRAFRARGSSFAADTSSDQMAQMREYLSLAKSYALQARELTPEHPIIYSNLVLIANATGDRLSASSAIREAIEWQPATYSARVAYLKHLEPKWGGSLADMQSFIDDSMNYLDINPALKVLQGYTSIVAAERYVHQKRDAEAISLITQALGFGEQHHWIAMRGRAYAREGDFVSAFQDFDDAIAAHPGVGEYYYRRAESFLRIADAGERQRQLARYQDFRHRANFDYTNPPLADTQRAISHNPESFKYYRLADFLLAREQNWPQIIEYWDRYIARDPSDARAYFERGGTHFHNGNREKALSDLQMAVDLGHEEAAGVYRRLSQ